MIKFLLLPFGISATFIIITELLMFPLNKSIERRAQKRIKELEEYAKTNPQQEISDKDQKEIDLMNQKFTRKQEIERISRTSILMISITLSLVSVIMLFINKNFYKNYLDILKMVYLASVFSTVIFSWMLIKSNNKKKTQDEKERRKPS